MEGGPRLPVMVEARGNAPRSDCFPVKPGYAHLSVANGIGQDGPVRVLALFSAAVLMW